MKYFSTLPQSTFTTTIGNFTIASFFSYYTYNDELLNRLEKHVDNKTTLTELSNQIYSDNNSIWLFLIANNTTDPYDLLEQNPTIYKDNKENNITLGISPYGNVSSTNTFNEGSIIAPFTNTGGSPWEYSYVGTWDINGPFALMESTDHYSGSSVIKEQKNTTVGNFIGVDNANDEIGIIQYSGETYSSDQGGLDPIYQTKNKSYEKDTVVYSANYKTGKLEPTDTNLPNVTDDGGYIVPPSTSGDTFSISNYDIIVQKDKTIYILPPSALPSLILKTLKY